MFELANRLRWGAGKAQRKRSAAFMVVSVAVLAGSFFFTLWITKPTPSGSAINDTAPADERALAGQQVATYGELRRAAERVGLRYSTFMHGTIDAITRTNDREVLMYGWLTDPEYGDGTPLKLVVFLAGASVVRTETKGERPDVTAALGLDFGSEKNVAFKMTFDCEHGQQPVVVGLGVRRQYLPLTATACP